MWPDNETDLDFLNFTGVADTVAEIIVQAAGRPISIGISGAWGVGKSSMIKLTRKSLEERSRSLGSDFVFAGRASAARATTPISFSSNSMRGFTKDMTTRALP